MNFLSENQIGPNITQQRDNINAPNVYLYILSFFSYVSGTLLSCPFFEYKNTKVKNTK